MKRIIGYSDPLSVAPGERIRFMVSCEADVLAYDATIVRMTDGDTRPAGCAARHAPVPGGVAGSFPGRKQAINPGTCIVVPAHDAFGLLRGLTVQASIYPTLLQRPLQTLVSLFDSTRREGFELSIDADACLVLRLGDGRRTETVRATAPLRERLWCFVSATLDHVTGAVLLYQEETPDGFERTQAHETHVSTMCRGIAVPACPLLIGAGCGTDTEVSASHFNGRIRRPALSCVATVERGDTRIDFPGAGGLVGCWDFSLEMSSSRIRDLSGHSCHGHTVNLPIRAVRGPDWTGAEMNWQHAPPHYDAIHFLEDALSDCAWDADFEWTVPMDCRSGCYAARLSAGSEEDYVPFFVRPPRAGAASARLAVVMPTFSYLAYANWRLPFENPQSELLTNALTVLGEEDQTLLARTELGFSLYDAHIDGTSAFHASRLRPNLNMRPDHPWREQYPADLYLIGWLEETGIAYDVLTDEDLHAEGAELLRRYACVMTGTHPEYTSTPMWDGIATYLRTGGRLMYMGGNGFVWRVGVPADVPGVIELRRAEGSSSVGSNLPGEYYMSSTGEYGGPWRTIGRPPARLVGVNYIAQGFDFSAPYRVLVDRDDPKVGFILEGIDADEAIGSFGVLGHGAAGLEIDRMDKNAGTPRHAVRVATSAGAHTVTYKLANTAMLDDPEIRSDLTYFETPHGGGVFSVGSMAWAAALPENGYRNNVATVTGNVLRYFLRDGPGSIPQSAETVP